jgi:hypothetical protein
LRKFSQAPSNNLKKNPSNINDERGENLTGEVQIELKTGEISIQR